MWRLLEYKMHDRSHAVIRLNVHLYQQQRIFFGEGTEEEALERANGANTKLTAWFQLNLKEAEANQYLYTDIPYHYVFKSGGGGVWEKRPRKENVIARMYTVGLNDQERFYLRLLLLHVRAATSYEFLRTVDGIQYETFKEAALQRGLLASDDEWDRLFTEAVQNQMPQQLRQTFASICIFCLPMNTRQLWEKFRNDFSLDFQRDYDNDTSANFALHEIESIFRQHGSSCVTFGLPEPIGVVLETAEYRQEVESAEAERRIGTLNDMQFDAFKKIIDGVNFPYTHKLYYLNGPGGSGKTYLYNTLISFIRGQGQSVLAFASTGIAATLMKGGRTIHSGFKLPVPLLETSVSSIRESSSEAGVLKKAALLIIDEVTMLSKHGLRCIDLLLRGLMKNDTPFGGKSIVIGGDWRQTLPVVPRGTRIDIVETCLIASPLWQHFKKLTLDANMRSARQDIFNKWLLEIGSGEIPVTAGLQEDSVQIPTDMCIKNDADIVNIIFGDNIENLSIDELAGRVILSTTNIQTLEINRTIIQKQHGEIHEYYSSDSIVSEDSNDINI